MEKFTYVIRNILLMAGVITFILAFIFYIYFPFKTNHGDNITVPNIVGMGLDNLESFLRDRDLRYEILEDSSYSSEYLPYTVLQQNPAADSKVKENRKIYLTINSKVPPKIKMPNIINGSVKNAQLILKSYDLKLGQIKYVPDLAMNAVIKIYKDGDSLSVDGLIEKGSIIDLDVGDGLGNQIFNAPDLIGLDFDEAKFTIIGSGLRVGLINYQDSGFVYNKILDDLGNEIYEKTKINPGRIFKQFPEKDVRVKIGRKVNLWIVEDSTNEQYQ
jgi:beta-lactam-binding protein with PASTA domain